MDGTLVVAASASALLHASWNAAVKGNPQPTQAMSAQTFASALIALVALPAVGLPTAGARPWMAVSTRFSMASVACLLRAYRHSGFGVAYPVTRAASVMLVLPLAAAVAGEWPRPSGLAGVAGIAAAVLLLALRGRAAVTRPGLAWSVAAACTACYVVCDAQGVRRSGSPLAYGCALSVVNALLWGWLQRRAGSPLSAPRAQWPGTLLVAAATVASYVLIPWV